MGFMNESNVSTKVPPSIQTTVVQKIKVFPKPEIKRLKLSPLKPAREPNQ
jgi:hypothetical protein